MFSAVFEHLEEHPEQLFEPPYRDIFDEKHYAPASNAEALSFLNWFRSQIRSEMHKDSAKRKARVGALGQVIDFMKNPSSSFYDLDAVNVGHIAVQLAYRIREPSMINQDQAGVCGPNSMIIYLAKNRPEAYAKLALDLFKSGTASFNNFQLLAPSIGGLFDWAPDMPLADHMVLIAAARGFANSLMRLLPTAAVQGNAPRTVLDALKSAGFANCDDKTLANFLGFGIGPGNVTAKSKQNLLDAQKDVKDGKCVVMMYSPDLVDLINGTLRQTHGEQVPRKPGTANLPDKGGTSTRPDHYSLLSDLEVEGSSVGFKLYTWGVSRRANIALNAFLTYYGGYVVGELTS